MEELIPALFVRCKIEEEIRDDQRATRYMQEEMFLEAWDACGGEDLKLAETNRQAWEAAVGWRNL